MSASPEWYRTLFSGLMVDVQRRIPAQTEAEADFLVEALAPPAGGKILDVPCGTGRLSVALAERGYAVTGVDLNTAVLDNGRKDAAERNLRVEFAQRDMRDLPWPGQFDSAFCFGNSFSYFDDDGNRDFLEAVHAALKPGGRFVLETRFCAEGVFQQMLKKAWFPLGDLFFLVDTAYDPATAQLTSSYTIIQDGRVERQQATYRIYTYRELLQLFRDAGFGNLETFGSLKREPFAIGSPGLWVVAVRNGERGMRS